MSQQQTATIIPFPIRVPVGQKPGRKPRPAPKKPSVSRKTVSPAETLKAADAGVSVTDTSVGRVSSPKATFMSSASPSDLSTPTAPSPIPYEPIELRAFRKLRTVAPSKPDPAFVVAQCIHWTRSRGIAMSSIPTLIRNQLQTLCDLGDPSALMVRDWLEGLGLRPLPTPDAAASATSASASDTVSTSVPDLVSASDPVVISAPACIAQAPDTAPDMAVLEPRLRPGLAAAILRRKIIRRAKAKGIDMSVLRPSLKRDLQMLCDAGEPEALMLRDWLSGKWKSARLMPEGV
ncbi:hypothetical protein FE840_000675 [Peteryoungia desertarenae]|uniref:Uncharacterized protein n=1 Tax=Peteryoungia desertarenae TaxID=1813451 RepID=A0ABX6QIT9_9HYPH|nr:hypothetical protein [Peteryoungia desertarenae]QLF68192.1 hypothetical protein FE840_000675 [Peteryoungia desertarenae]